MDKVLGIETPEPFKSRFEALGIAAVTYAHRPVFTVAEGGDIKAQIKGAHTKNLFLKDKKDACFLVTAQDETVIDLKKLGAHLGAGRLSFANPARLLASLGVVPGAVSPLALINDKSRLVRPVLDHTLMGQACLNCHPLENNKTTGLRPQDLVVFMENMGYSPLIVDFSML